MKILILSVILLLSYNISAKNYYVNARNGNKRNNGLSVSKAKSLIQDAANLTRPGDTVFVMKGTYTNSCANCSVVDIPNSGNKRKYIVYTNYKDHQPIVSFNGWGGFSVANGVSYVKIIGFEVIGNNKNILLKNALKQPMSCLNPTGDYDPKYNGNGISIDGRSGKHPHHIVVAKNVVRDCGGGGIGANQVDYIIIEDNIVYNNAWYNVFGNSGISLYQFKNFDNAKGYHNVIRRNKCYNNKNLVPWAKYCRIADGNGIIIDDFRNQQNSSKLGVYTGKTLIENNICWFNGGTGIHVFQSDDVDIFNNTAYCNSQSIELNSGQIHASVSSKVRIINNILVSDSSNLINSNFQNTYHTYLNNLHYNITKPGNMDATINNVSCISGISPVFILPINDLNANLMLHETSPAIGRGLLGVNSRDDFNQHVRPIYKPATLGAYEMQ